MDVSSIARILHHEAGYAEQNKTRLKNGLTKDKRTAKANGGEFRIRVGARDELDKQFGSIAQIKIAKVTNSVIPVELFQCTRGYIEKVVHQLNASYDCGLFDCTAVMCRRLLETLIIEAYEKIGRQATIKDSDDNYMMYSGLLSVVENDLKSSKLSLSRNSLKGLKDYKKLGDQSAHNRRFNARQDDIDRVRDGLRIASEELLHIAGLTN